LFRVIPLVVSYKKLRAAGSTALRVLAMVRSFREPNSAGAKDFARRSGDTPASGKVARVMVGCWQGRRYEGELGQHFGNEFRMVHYADVEFCVRGDLSVVLI
jgi:hypothetical protein